jgi:hypothetical protein
MNVALGLSRVDLHAGGCSNKLAPIRVVCSLLLNTLLCSHLRLVVVVLDADGDPDSTQLFGGCSDTCLASWNALRCLRPVFTRLQAARSTSRSPRFLRHWFGSKPPGSVNGALLPVVSFFNLILSSSAMLLHNAALDLFKPTLCEALPHHQHQASATPLLPSAGALPSGDVCGSGSESFRDLSIIGSYTKSLIVTLLF